MSGRVVACLKPRNMCSARSRIARKWIEARRGSLWRRHLTNTEDVNGTADTSACQQTNNGLICLLCCDDIINGTSSTNFPSPVCSYGICTITHLCISHSYSCFIITLELCSFPLVSIPGNSVDLWTIISCHTFLHMDPFSVPSSLFFCQAQKYKMLITHIQSFPDVYINL